MTFKRKIILSLLISYTVNPICYSQNRSNIKSIADSVEFIYPLAVGNTWVYKYYLYLNWTSGDVPPSKVVQGSHTWEIDSLGQSNDTTTYYVTCAIIDTVMLANYLGTAVDTTIQKPSVPFTIIALPNETYVHWDETVSNSPNFGEVPIPKYLTTGQTYFHVTDQMFANANYFSGLGLWNYAYTRHSNTTIIEKLDLVLFNSQLVLVQENGAANKLPKSYSLQQNYPNPFNPTTIIQYEIPYRTSVNLTVLDVLGRQIATLVNEEKGAGTYAISFDASRLTSGIYFYRIRTGVFAETRKMLLIK